MTTRYSLYIYQIIYHLPKVRSPSLSGILFPPHPLLTLYQPLTNKAIGIQMGARIERAERDKERMREERSRIHGGHRASKRQLMCRGYNGGWMAHCQGYTSSECLCSVSSLFGLADVHKGAPVGSKGEVRGRTSRSIGQEHVRQVTSTRSTSIRRSARAVLLLTIS